MGIERKRVYLVGGAIRDRLLKRRSADRDYVVIGTTVEEMIAEGFIPVGGDFPVFLHPQTKEHYALARTERKSGVGYHGFTFYTEPDVTLEADLQRRDLTINAIAESYDGAIIDPYHGVADIDHKILRHVSAAFREDPVRILRVARFAARLPDFNIAPETKDLMSQIVQNGESDHLVGERVWQEAQRALGETRPSRFFDVLADCGYLPTILPEVTRLDDSDFRHIMTLLDYFATHHTTRVSRLNFAALLHLLENEAAGAIYARLNVPNAFMRLGNALIKHHRTMMDAANLSAEDIFRLLKSLRNDTLFDDALTFCEAKHRCQHGEAPYLTGDLLQKAKAALRAVDAATIAQQTTPQTRAAAITDASIRAIDKAIK